MGEPSRCTWLPARSYTVRTCTHREAITIYTPLMSYTHESGLADLPNLLPVEAASQHFVSPSSARYAGLRQRQLTYDDLDSPDVFLDDLRTAQPVEHTIVHRILQSRFHSKCFVRKGTKTHSQHSVEIRVPQ